MGDGGELAAEKHVRYIVTVEKRKDSFESLVMEHIRLNGAYWGLTTLDLLHKLRAVEADEVIEWIMSCYHPESGGFGGNVGHDAHVLYTLSAVQVLCLFDRLDALDVDKTLLGFKMKMDHFLVIFGVKWTLAVRTWMVDLELCQEVNHTLGRYFVVLALSQSLARCITLIEISLDGGFVSVSAKREGSMDGLRNLLIVHWIDKDKLAKFILNCQDKENGGISDRPDNAVDIYHTYFGVAGLSLMEYPGVKPMDPAYALPLDVVNRIFLRKEH
uniref:Geranylgeranyl transferase type II subunit beta n=1 Tax=Oryza nivara TaxID=4536 RepID=A0A0E0IED4_ORYNI